MRVYGLFNMDTENSTSVKTSDVDAHLSAWALRMDSFDFERYRLTGALALEILIDGVFTRVVTINATSTHSYRLIEERTSSGASKLFKLYNLGVKGTNDTGRNFTFRTSLSFESEDGGNTWSDPCKKSSLLWV